MARYRQFVRQPKQGCVMGLMKLWFVLCVLVPTIAGLIWLMLVVLR